MEFSFLIVTRNRPEALAHTLYVLQSLIDPTKHEVLVYIDACTQTEHIKDQWPWVKWSGSEVQVSASPARNALYSKAVGDIFIGLDDDAHPISNDFLESVALRFRESVKIGILSFQEVRGIYTNDEAALHQAKNGSNFKTADFVGCGFAITKEAYQATNGFPTWIDIYGEEPALALEVLDAGYDIVYCYDIVVNHRVDTVKRALQGRNYFRFEHQLQNTLRAYRVYYEKPFQKVVKTLWHNFKKYALTDFKYFTLWSNVIWSVFISKTSYLKARKPVKATTISLRNELKGIPY